VPAEQIIAADQRVYDSIATINPVLIHLVPDDPQRHLKWVFQERCLAPDPRSSKGARNGCRSASRCSSTSRVRNPL